MTRPSRRVAIATVIALLALTLFAGGRMSTTASRLLDSAAIWRSGEAYLFILVRTAYWSGSRAQHWLYSVLERLPLVVRPGVSSRGDTVVFRIRPGAVDKMTIQGDLRLMRVWRDGFYHRGEKRFGQASTEVTPWLRWTGPDWQPVQAADAQVFAAPNASHSDGRWQPVDAATSSALEALEAPNVSPSQGFPVNEWEREPRVLTRTPGWYDVPISPDKSVELRVHNWTPNHHFEVRLKRGTSDELLWSMTEQVRFGLPTKE